MTRLMLAILLPVAVGLPFTLWLPSWLVRIAMAFLGGVVIITAAVAATGVADRRLAVVGLAVVTAVWLLAAGVAVRRSWASITARVSRPRWAWPAWVLLILAALNVATAAAYAWVVPLASHDVIVIWLPKIRVLGSQGFRGLGGSLFADYPPLWPVHLFLADGGGRWWKLLPAIYLVCTMAIVFAYVRSRVGPSIAAGCALAISGVPYIWMPYGVNDLLSEVPALAFVTASAITLADYADQPSRRTLALAVLLGSGAVLVRPEGFVYAFVIGAVAVAIGIVRHRVRETSAAAAALALVYLGWQAIVHFVFHDTATYRFGPAVFDLHGDLTSLVEVMRYAATYLGNPYVFGPAIIAAAAIALGYHRWRAFVVVLSIFVADLLCAIVMYALLPATDVGEPLTWWLTTGFKRVVLHFVPLLYVAAAIAIAGLLQRDGVFNQLDTQIRKTNQLEEAVTLPVAAIVLVSLCIAVAAYAAYRVGGPKSYDLSAMAPAHVSGSQLDLLPGAMRVTTETGSVPKVVFYLQNTGRREPPLDNISGVFQRFSSQVAVESGSTQERFTASVDGFVIGEATANPGAGPVGLGGQIPVGGRFLELSVTQLGSGSGTASWGHPTVYRATQWWAVEAFLMVGLAVLVASTLAGAGIVRPHPWLNPGVAALALLAAAAVQQSEAMWEVAVPIWAGAAELVIHNL